MKTRLLVSIVGALASAFLLFGCATGGGAPTGHGQVVIRGKSIDQVQSRTEDVFHRHGFSMAGMGPGEMRFERRGGATENLLYGNWNENKTITRVTVFISRVDDNGVRLRSRGEVIRDTFGGEANSVMFDATGGRFNSLLRKIKRELDEI